MIISAIRRAGAGKASQIPRAEVVVFEEPGVRIQNKSKGKGKSKKSKDKLNRHIDKKVQKIYNEERIEGNALPAVIGDMELTTALRTEVFELGATNMDIATRGKALEKWKKSHRAAHEKLEKWTPVQKNKLTYPELMNKVREDRAEAFVAKERQYYGDDMVNVDVRSRTKRKRGFDAPSHLQTKHMVQPKVGKLKDAVLTLTNQDVRQIKFDASKKKRR